MFNLVRFSFIAALSLPLLFYEPSIKIQSLLTYFTCVRVGCVQATLYELRYGSNAAMEKKIQNLLLPVGKFGGDGLRVSSDRPSLPPFACADAGSQLLTNVLIPPLPRLCFVSHSWSSSDAAGLPEASVML